MPAAVANTAQEDAPSDAVDEAGLPLTRIAVAEATGLQLSLLVDAAALAAAADGGIASALTLSLEPSTTGGSSELALTAPPGVRVQLSARRLSLRLRPAAALRCACRYAAGAAARTSAAAAPASSHAEVTLSAAALVLRALERYAGTLQLSTSLRVSCSAAGEAGDVLLRLEGKTTPEDPSPPLQIDVEVQRADVEEEVRALALALSEIYAARESLLDSLLGAVAAWPVKRPQSQTPAELQPPVEAQLPPEPQATAELQAVAEPVGTAAQAPASPGDKPGFQLPFSNELGAAWNGALRGLGGGK